MERSKKFDFGKIDYLGCGRKINRVTIEVCEGADGTVSIHGDIENNLGTDSLCCGQILDDVPLTFFNNKLYNTIYSIWRKWHLKKIPVDNPDYVIFNNLFA